MQFLSIFNKYKVLAAQYLGDAMGHFPFRYTFIFVVRYQFQFAINLRHQCRLVPALMHSHGSIVYGLCHFMRSHF